MSTVPCASRSGRWPKTRSRRAAEVDRTAEFPWDVHDALVRADLQEVHVPEAGADAIATVIVIEEVARAARDGGSPSALPSTS